MSQSTPPEPGSSARARAPPEPDPARTTEPASPGQTPGRPRRRVWPFVIGGVAVLLVAALGIVGWYVYSLNTSVSQNIRRNDSLPTAGGSDRPSADPAASGALNFVLLGSDSRNPDDAAEGRSDTIMVVHLNKARDKAYIVSFPRDMWVSIPGHGKDKINAAYSLGGAQLTVSTLESLLDTRVDHVVQVDFEGFIALTEGLGGITVNNTNAFTSHGFTYPKGEITIKGEEALWFVRERKSLPNGDLDRAENQRKVIKAIVAKGLSREVISDPARFTAFIAGVAQHVVVDQSLSDEAIRSIAFSLRLSATSIESLQAPISGFATIQGQSVDVVDEAKLTELGTAIRKDTMDKYLAKHPKG